MPIPADVIVKLTEVAGRMADRSMGVRPTEAAAVATPRDKALEFLFHMGTSDREHRPVYVITMTGLFLPRGHFPGSGRMPKHPVRTVVLDASTLRLLDRSTTDHDHRALLPQLGPVSILPIPPSDQPQP